MTAMKWRGGTFTTEALAARLPELAKFIRERAEADRSAGRLVAAEIMEEVVEAYEEQIRLLRNAVVAQKSTIAILRGREG